MAKSKKAARSPHLLARQLETLRELRASYAPAATRTRFGILRALSRTSMGDVRQLIEYHDLLCFLRAYPDNETVLHAVEAELVRFHKRVALLKSSTGVRHRDELENSGLVGTTVVHPFSFDVLNLLLSHYPESFRIDWAASEDDVADKLEEWLPALVSWPENDILDNDFTFDFHHWLKRGKANAAEELHRFVGLLAGSGLPRHVQRHLYDLLAPVLTWELGTSGATRTLKRVPCAKPFFQQEPLRRRPSDLRMELAKPARKLRRLSIAEGVQRVRDVNEVLAVRYRELFPLTMADPREVYAYDAGRGVVIYVYGSKSEARLPLESNFGALLTRNGLPVGYGVGATFFERVEIAINVFPAFRSGESAFIISEFFKLFHQHFGSRVLLVRSRQVGDGDDEPIQSGAFWFYYKLGFRPVRKPIRRLAAEQAARLARRPGTRSSVAMLKRLSKSDVVLAINPAEQDYWRELSVVKLGFRVTDNVNRQFRGNRAAAITSAVQELSRILAIRDMKRWPDSEKQALERLSLLLVQISSLGRWSAEDKRALVGIIRAKGGAQEREYTLAGLAHRRLKRALEQLAGE